MRLKTSLIVLLLLFGTTIFTYSQTSQEVFETSSRVNKNGMLILGGWAIANMAYGAYGSIHYKHEKKYFHQMNLMWNVVNAGIAGFALYNFATTDYSILTHEQMLNEHLETQKLYLINAGLDLAYIAGGAYLVHKSKSSLNYPHLLEGYGKSVILQGGFLFVFDVVMYLIQTKQTSNFYRIAENVNLTTQGFSLTLSF